MMYKRPKPALFKPAKNNASKPVYRYETGKQPVRMCIRRASSVQRNVKCKNQPDQPHNANEDRRSPLKTKSNRQTATDHHTSVV